VAPAQEEEAEVVEMEFTLHVQRKDLGHVLLGWAIGIGILLCSAFSIFVVGGWGVVLGVGGLVPGYKICRGIWEESLHLKMQLSSPPREVHGWRKNIFTRIVTHHVYRLTKNAKVRLRMVIKNREPDVTLWQITIDGVPDYYDFGKAGNATTFEEAKALGSTIARYLGLPFVTGAGEHLDPGVRFGKRRKG
jgi:hypothetical protein